MRFKTPDSLRIVAAFIVSSALLISACGNPRMIPGNQLPGVQARVASPELAQSLLSSGDSVQAAHVYAQLSSTESDPLIRQQYQLLATELYFDNELYNDGARMLATLPEAMASEPLQLRRTIAYAYYTIAQQNPQQAIDQLPDPQNIADLNVKARIFEAQARAQLMLNDPTQALKTRVQLDASLTTPAALSVNHQRIWNMLQALDNQSLQQLARTPAGPVYRGWVEYALIARTEAESEAAIFERRVGLWRSRYGDHPAEAIANSSNDLPNQQPANINNTPFAEGLIAVLLPLSGQFSELGAAIKTGFIAAHYADGGSANVRFYDTKSDTNKAIEQYQLAAAEGANLIVGPLSKAAVINLAASNQITVPTLSLNYLGDDIPGNNNLYQFGLLPEDEATDAANFAALASYQNAIIINADSSRAQRLATAFDKRFTESGGKVIGTEIIEADTYDYSRQLRKLLAINSSNGRKRNLEKILDADLKFEPAIRNDIDVIFMAVDSDQARLLRPQLKFHRAGEVPVLSTAMVYSGSEDPKADGDLSGVRFNEIPWILSEIPARTPTYRDIAPYTQDDSAGFQRLNALGMDAYLLHKELDQMRLNAFHSVDGKTGALSLAQGNRIQRRLFWAEFQEGIPVQTTESIPVEAILPPMQAADTQFQFQPQN